MYGDEHVGIQYFVEKPRSGDLAAIVNTVGQPLIPSLSQAGSAYSDRRPARDNLTEGTSRAVLSLAGSQGINKSINQIADARDLSVGRRPLNEITVRVIHEDEISNEQENSDRWISQAVAAGYHVDGVAILIERDVECPREIHGHAFRRIGKICEGAVLSGAGDDKATVREVNHTLPSGNRTLDVKAADARKSERLIYNPRRGTTTRVRERKFRCRRAKRYYGKVSCY
jgi:hypothetical protein